MRKGYHSRTQRDRHRINLSIFSWKDSEWFVRFSRGSWNSERHLSLKKYASKNRNYLEIDRGLRCSIFQEKPSNSTPPPEANESHILLRCREHSYAWSVGLLWTCGWNTRGSWNDGGSASSHLSRTIASGGGVGNCGSWSSIPTGGRLEDGLE